MDYSIVRYSHKESLLWDLFVRDSRNGTFLFRRDYMDYHSDRFRDCSWMAYRNGKLVAILPANIDEEGVLHSHQGLTYGGWILPPEHLDGAALLEIFTEAIDEWRKMGIKEVDYKPMPFIYAGQPSQEDIYALFRLGATLTEINLSSAINLLLPPHYNKLRKRALAKTSSLPIVIEEVNDCEKFMVLVAECLTRRHGTRPVHNSQEIKYLRGLFPENIRMYIVRYKESDSYEAGVMVYDTGRVAHAQYIATTEQGRKDNLLTPLFDYLIKEYGTRAYFDFGISNEDHGLYLNEGLLRQKFSYGATGVAYTRWSLKI